MKLPKSSVRMMLSLSTDDTPMYYSLFFAIIIASFLTPKKT